MSLWPQEVEVSPWQGLVTRKLVFKPSGAGYQAARRAGASSRAQGPRLCLERASPTGACPVNLCSVLKDRQVEVNACWRSNADKLSQE
jgi:hypothetical protein